MFFRRILCSCVLITLASCFAFSQQTESGQAIFSQKCAKCHGEKGEGMSGAITIAGPCLQAEHDIDAVLRTVRNGKGLMPSYNSLLSPQQMQGVARYVTQEIATIPLTGGNLNEGGALFRIYCAPCHRTDARGGALAFTGANAPSLAGFSPAVVAGTIRWGPGPMPAFPSSVLNNQQLASVVQYVAFVQNPPNPGGSPLGYYGPVAEGFAGWVGVLVLIVITGWIEKGGRG